MYGLAKDIGASSQKRMVYMGKYIRLEDVKKIVDETFEVVNDADDFMKMVDSVSIVDVVPLRRGKWIEYAGSLVKCSICGYEYIDHIECDAFCGNCGAKMDAYA